ncbi:DUF3618 domain-containing protein [Williamsia sp. MIQD14]|uniref:DUF3618 domain-containing protein n=1 Tax=Williamsia herbipolensis TaxID=1603258 RepID=A0AAU4K2P9_9NOCA|nr:MULTISPECIES: DUF3618 domain-containing protein [Williamsia]KQR98921.1 hypothetical protein ASG12_11355 [Williamsia sp. Leaf354]MCX6468109.1 DUF3618 domain-containing protein [Mycobacteriales bacterium]
MARDTDSIERDIARAREELASTLDTLAVRANPQRLAEDAKNGVLATLNAPAIKFPLIGVGVIVVALTLKKLVS